MATCSEPLDSFWWWLAGLAEGGSGGRWLKPRSFLRWPRPLTDYGVQAFKLEHGFSLERGSLVRVLEDEEQNKLEITMG